jgi:hypothetical protein
MNFHLTERSSCAFHTLFYECLPVPVLSILTHYTGLGIREHDDCERTHITTIRTSG